MKIILNDKIILESITKETAETLYPLFMEDISELNRWFGFDSDYSINNEYQYIEERKLPYEDAIIVIYYGVPCGRFGLYDYNPLENSLYMYYWISSRYRRKGIASTVMGFMLEYLQRLHVKEVLFNVDRENTGSINLLENRQNVRLKSQDKHLIYSCLL